MKVNLSKAVSFGIAALTAFSVSLPSAISNAPPHYFVVPGTCELQTGDNSSVTFLTVSGKPGLRLFSNAPDAPFASSAEFLFESTNPVGSPTNFPVPQGTFSFDLVNNTPDVLDVIQVIAYYDNGTVFLLDTGVENAASGHYSFNTVSNLGNLRGIGLRYTAEFNGNVIVSNFQNNSRPQGINLGTPIGCLALPVAPTAAKARGWSK